ncbi:MAG TPA: hypothetical protein VHV32_19520 [Candidatus Angelobacter sp.]|jgi:hypothetical protein|nr:hypothetical protein [Candidatus Angelobacter sp.]
MAGSFYGLSIRDSSNEIGKAEWNIGDLTALTLAGALTEMGALKTAIDAVIIGQLASERWGDNDVISNAIPSSGLAQRGVKWNVLIEDNTTHLKTTNYIPTADLSLLPAAPGGGKLEDLDITTGVGAALKAAIEALVKYPGTGNAVTVLRVYYSD